MMNYTIGLWGMKWNQSMSSLPLWTGDHVTLEFVCRVSGWTEVVKRSDHLAPAKLPQPPWQSDRLIMPDGLPTLATHLIAGVATSREPRDSQADLPKRGKLMNQVDAIFT